MADFLSWIANPENAERLTQIQQHLRCSRVEAALLELSLDRLELERERQEEEAEDADMPPDDIMDLIREAEQENDDSPLG